LADNSLAKLEITVHNQKDQSERLAELKKRANRCVCHYCGTKLGLRKITYAAYDEAKIEIFCDTCGRIEFGIEPELYQVAAYFVDEIGFDHYPSMDHSVNKTRMNIALICDIISWSFKNTGLLDKDGFKTQLDLGAGVLGEATLVSDRELNEQKGE